MSGEQLLKPAEVCSLLSVSRTWVYAAAADGRIPSIRLGGEDGPLRFVKADLEAWLEETAPGVDAWPTLSAKE